MLLIRRYNVLYVNKFTAETLAWPVNEYPITTRAEAERLAQLEREEHPENVYWVEEIQ